MSLFSPELLLSVLLTLIYIREIHVSSEIQELRIKWHWNGQNQTLWEIIDCLDDAWYFSTKAKPSWEEKP